MTERDEWTVIGGALSTFFADGQGPSTADIESAFDLGSYHEPLGDRDGNKQRRVATAMRKGTEEERQEIARELIDRLRERGVFSAGSREPEKATRLRAAVERAGWSLTDEGYLERFGPASSGPAPWIAPTSAVTAPAVGAAVPRLVTHPVDVGDLETVLRRVPAATRPLVVGRRGRKGIEVRDEYGVQDLVEVALRLVADDVRAEDPASAVAGSSSIIDFFLPARRTAVELKVTRPGRGEKEIKRELVVDFHDFGKHPDVDRVVAVVYDLAGTFKNPAGFEAGLTGQVNGVETKAIVCPWPRSESDRSPANV
jgi:hypothetical protein